MILGIETSCDECSASIVRYQSDQSIQVLGLETFSQIKIHQPYGGVVPEIASRNHLETINLMIDRALESAQVRLRDLDAVAVTNRPGLVGALLVGVSAAKALAYGLNKPLVPVHHLEGHASSIFLDREAGEGEAPLPLPILLAVVSGGHTNLYCVKEPPERWSRDFLKSSLIGRSRDDAAGEAFDKIAKVVGFPYPGGVWIDREAQKGAPKFSLPRALPQKDTFDFSFSGLKTAAALLSAKLKREGVLEERLPDFCSSVQEAIIDALLTKITLAIKKFHCKTLAIVGGVAANSSLRSRLAAEWKATGLACAPVFPKLTYCTDNAAMIAGAGAFRFKQGHFLTGESLLTLNAIANPEV